MMETTPSGNDESTDNHCTVSDFASHWDGDVMFAVVRDDEHDDAMVTAVHADRDAATAAARELTGNGVIGRVHIVPAHVDGDEEGI